MSNSANWDGVRYVRERLAKTDRQLIELNIVWQDYLRSIEESSILQRDAQRGPLDLKNLFNNLAIVKQRLEAVETQMVTKGIHNQTTIPKVPNTGFLEKLKIPVFTGDDF